MFFKWQDGDLILNVRVQTRACSDNFAETISGPQGKQIKVRIKAAPIEGRANKHLITFLARSFGIARSRIRLLSGETSRDKRLRISRPEILPDCIKQARPDWIMHNH